VESQCFWNSDRFITVKKCSNLLLFTNNWTTSWLLFFVFFIHARASYFICIIISLTEVVTHSFSLFLSTYFAVPVISCGFVKFLSQFEGDLSVFEGALGADHHLVSLLADDYSRLGHITDLPGGKAHTWMMDRGDILLLAAYFTTFLHMWVN